MFGVAYTYDTKSANIKRKFTHELKSHGIRLRKGTYCIDDNTDVVEIQNRKTGEPVFAAILIEM